MDNLEKIDEMYDKMLESSEMITNNPEEAMKKIDEIKEAMETSGCLEEINPDGTPKYPTPEYTTVSTSESPINITEVVQSQKVLGRYNPENGEISVADSEVDIDFLTRKNWDAFNKKDVLGSSEINTDILKKILNNNDLKDFEEVEQMVSLISRVNKGEKIEHPYFELPKSYRDEVDALVAEMANTNVDEQAKSKKYIASMFISQLMNEYKKTESSVNTMDLETMLAGFNKDMEDFTNQSSVEFGTMMMSFDDERKAEIDAAIKRCREEGNIEAIGKLQSIRDTIDSASNLTEFIEACKHIKIKRYELENPKRVFNSFNYKYEKHQNIINDISTCPDILSRHLHQYDDKSKLMLCLAFCKYCLNFSPDDMGEHTFMYYFIRNIIMADRLNPKGNLYEGMDERSKKFYDSFTGNLAKCIDNLLERNVTLK